MSSESTPVVIIDYDNPSGFYWDVSTITTKIVYEYGRNRPFALAEVVVKKAYFNSDTLYWNKVARCPKGSDGKVILPNITLGETKIHIEAYGESYNMYIEKMTSNEDYITLLCYNSAYKLKSALYLSSLTNVFSMLVPVKDESTSETVMVKKYYLESDPLNPLNLLPSEDNRLRLEYVLNISDTQYHSIIINCILIDASTIKVDYIEGLSSDIFRFVAINGAGYDAGNCIVDEGYSYNYNIFYKEGTDLILNEYTEDQIRQIKSTTPYIIPSDDYVKLRVNYLCWDVIKALGYLSNRYAFFYDRAYFVDYNNSAYCNIFEEMSLDYGVDEFGESKSYTIDSKKFREPLDIYAIVDSLDQGTTYVMSGQEVASENHSEYVYITDAVHPVEGTQIVFPYPESYNLDASSNQTRDKLTRKLALERLVTNYRPLDCIQFTISEIGSGSDDFTPSGIVTSYDELPSDQPVETIYQVTDGLMNSYYVYRSTGWEPYTFATYTNTRKSRFDVYSCIGKLVDKQNNIEMENAPLSYVQLSWPECVTTLSFGNPEFIDSAWQLANLEQGNETSVAEGTTDLSISDRQAAKIVVGNQTLSELNDDRKGFTGLILEKNRDKELYRLSGYNNGQLEAFFDSKGRILSGNASFKPDGSGELVLDSGVMIDHNGITITGSKSNYVEYDVDSNGNKITNLSDFTMSTNGSSTGTIVLNGSGMTTRNSSGTIQCEVTTEGKISAGSGKVVLDANGISIKDINGNTQLTSDDYTGLTTAKGSVTIDSDGLTTRNSSGVRQCYVGINGIFYAGEGKVRLDSAGLKIMSGSSVLCRADANGIYSENEAVFIDNEGLKTYNSSGILQCQVGVDGAMTAGAGNVKLDSSGVTISHSSGITAGDTYLRFEASTSKFVMGSVDSLVYFGPNYKALGLYCLDSSGNIDNKSQILIRSSILGADSNILLDEGKYVTCTTDANFPLGKSDLEDNSGNPISYTWYYTLGTCYNTVTGGFSGIVFMECGGYLKTTSAGQSTVEFPIEFATFLGANATTIRSTFSGNGNDYVYDASTTGMSIKHDGKDEDKDKDRKGGVYWRAWGYIIKGLTYSVDRIYFGKSKSSGNYTFSYDSGSLDNPKSVSTGDHKELFRKKGDKKLSANASGYPILVDP